MWALVCSDAHLRATINGKFSQDEKRGATLAREPPPMPTTRIGAITRYHSHRTQFFPTASRRRYDRSQLALTLEPLYAAEAKRMHDANGGDHGNQHTGGKVAARQISDTPPKVRTDEQLAKLPEYRATPSAR